MAGHTTAKSAATGDTAFGVTTAEHTTTAGHTATGLAVGSPAVARLASGGSAAVGLAAALATSLLRAD